MITYPLSHRIVVHLVYSRPNDLPPLICEQPNGSERFQKTGKRSGREEKVIGGTWLMIVKFKNHLAPLSSSRSPHCTPPACLYWTTFTFSLAGCAADENSKSTTPSRYILSPKSATDLDSWIEEGLAVHHAIQFVEAEPKCCLLSNPRGVPDPSFYFWLPPIFEHHSGTPPTSHLPALFAQGGRGPGWNGWNGNEL